MTKCRSILGFTLLVVWIALPALACLPTQGMTQAEVACCKKMAGDCPMGAGRHPCCKTTVNRPLTVAKIEHSVYQLQPDSPSTLLSTAPLPKLCINYVSDVKKLGLPPPAPPALNSVLRI